MGPVRDIPRVGRRVRPADSSPLSRLTEGDVALGQRTDEPRVSYSTRHRATPPPRPSTFCELGVVLSRRSRGDRRRGERDSEEGAGGWGARTSRSERSKAAVIKTETMLIRTSTGRRDPRRGPSVGAPSDARPSLPRSTCEVGPRSTGMLGGNRTSYRVSHRSVLPPCRWVLLGPRAPSV